MYLASAHTTNDLPGGANVTTGASRTAVIEYSGVVVVAPDTQQLVAVEDGQVRQLKSSVLSTNSFNKCTTAEQELLLCCSLHFQTNFHGKQVRIFTLKWNFQYLTIRL